MIVKLDFINFLLSKRILIKKILYVHKFRRVAKKLLFWKKEKSLWESLKFYINKATNQQ